MKTIGQKIRALRREKEWSQGDAANKLHLSVPAYSKIETGITDINLSRLEQVAEMFGLSTAELLTYGESQTTAKDRLSTTEEQVNYLQSKVIDLYEQLWKLNNTVNE